jgi:RimJ/RimL family protein N-acetyltransferase
MHLLNDDKGKTVKSLLQSETFDHTFSYSVIEGIIKGDVFVDNEDTPNSVLVSIPNGIHHLFGNAKDTKFNLQVKKWFDNEIQNRKKPLVLFAGPEWERLIQSWKFPLDKQNRISFVFNLSLFLEKGIKSGGAVGYRVDKLTHEHIRNSEAFPDRFYKIYWGSQENFAEHGFGFCLIEEETNTIVSEATSPASCSHSIDIDIHTNELFRGKGLAKQLADVFLNHCIKNNRRPVWACDESNLASISLAEGIGFEKAGIHPVFILRHE